MKDRLLNLPRAAELLGIAANSLYKAADRGQLKTQPLEHRAGKVFPVVTIGDLMAWRDARIKHLKDAPDPQSKRWLATLQAASLTLPG